MCAAISMTMRGRVTPRFVERIGAVRDELGIPEHVLMHLSTPPGFYGTIAERLGAAALAQSENGWRRVIIEKPFGQDAKSAMKLEGDVS